DFVAQPSPLLIVGDAAMDQHRRRLLAARTGDREGGDVAGLEAGQLLDRPFDVLRPVIAAVDDDHVLGAADDEDVATGHVAHVAGIEPSVGRQACGGGFRISEIADHDGLAANEYAADSAVGELDAVGAADLDLHPGDGLPAVADRPIAAWAPPFTTGVGAAFAAGKLGLLDQLHADSLAR